MPKIEAKRTARILAALEPVAAPDYRLAPHLQRIVEASKTAPHWDTANDRFVVPDALHRSFPDAGDGRPMPPMGDEFMTAGLSAEDARFIAVQLAQNGWTLTPNPVDDSQPADPAANAPDPAVIREAWEKAYWRMRSYAVHDNDCKLNKPPHFNGPCSCGLTAALEEALALIQKGTAAPTEYERKVAQMKKDFPNGI